ncbi:MAG TPA: FecR family protein [Sunxiuqinia sp.]|nr:FecR family protein [Sunxiuqinia sp.]
MDLKKRKYESLEVVDLVLNEDFWQLVCENDGANLLDFIEGASAHRQNIRLASKIILGLQTKKQAQSLDRKYKLWMKIQGSQRRERNFSLLRYAAVLILLVSLGTGALFYVSQPPQMVEFADSNPTNFDQSRLFLPNGKDMDLGNSHPHVESVDGGKSIVLNDSIQVKQTGMGFNQLVVPYGKRGTVILADGTRVEMNSGSRLIFPPQFTGDEREVYLEGEAYFKVTKNPKKPFFVHTDKFKVRVLGTTFNVQAYKKQNLYNTVLVEGKVKLTVNDQLFASSVIMKPNQIASLTDDNEHIDLEKVDNIGNHISWIHGYLEFKDENVEALLKRISSYYNIQVEIRGNTHQIRIDGKLDLKEDPERILSGIAVMSKMHYLKKGENTYLLYQ